MERLTTALYAPIRGVRTYLEGLSRVFTTRFLVLLFVVNFACKGLLMVIVNNGMLPLFKDAGASGPELQVLQALAMSPWAMKPFIGVVCDVFPLGGYYKRYWMAGACVCGMLGAFALIAELHVIPLTVLFFFFVHLEISTLDLLSEGKYAEYMADNPESGSDVITFVNGAQRLGYIVALLFTGPLADASLFQPLFFVSLLAAASPFFFVLRGWLPELGGETVQWGRARQDLRILLVVGATGLLSPALGALTVYANRFVGLAFALGALVFCGVGGWYAFSPLIAKVALFQMLTGVGKIDVGGAMDYFYTADAECLPGGPGFSFKYYITYTGLVSACISFVAVLGYQAWFGRWRFRHIFALGILLKCVASVFDLIIVMRWNVALGVSDHVFYIFGEAIVENVVGMLFWIPSSTIIGKVCPPGREATVYAFIAGISNLSGGVSAIVGAIVSDLAGLITVLPDCNWDALPWLTVVGHMILPVVVGLPAIFLIPNARQTDRLDHDGDIQPNETETFEDAFELVSFTTDGETLIDEL